MPSCSYCNHTVSYDAAFCPSCGKQKPAYGSGAAMVFFLILGIFAVIYIAPALLINMIMGRFSSDLISGSLGDSSSWIFSTIVWASIGIYYWYNKK
jgi:hypothetical protein